MCDCAVIVQGTVVRNVVGTDKQRVILDVVTQEIVDLLSVLLIFLPLIAVRCIQLCEIIPSMQFLLSNEGVNTLVGGYIDCIVEVVEDVDTVATEVTVVIIRRGSQFTTFQKLTEP